jgi:hypothetical protein
LEQRLAAMSQAEQQANSSNSQRLATFNERINRLEHEIDERLGPATLHESQRTVESKIEAKLVALEERLKSTPGKLPVARSWKPETVVYQSEFVSCEGALWQAKKDTATKPGSADWICVARAGQDAITPAVRGTYDVHEKYQQLDMVAMDGGTFIARKDNPGPCPVSGDWQLLCRQGRTGKPGARGPAGSPGSKGEKGDPGVSTVSWQVDRAQYRVSPLMSDGTVGSMLDLHPIAQQLLDDVGKYYDWDRE